MKDHTQKATLTLTFRRMKAPAENQEAAVIDIKVRAGDYTEHNLPASCPEEYLEHGPLLGLIEALMRQFDFEAMTESVAEKVQDAHAITSMMEDMKEMDAEELLESVAEMTGQLLKRIGIKNDDDLKDIPTEGSC